MKNVFHFLVLLLILGGCKEKDLTPQLLGTWEAVLPDANSYKNKIEFTKKGIIDLGRIGCYCEGQNNYKMLNNKIEISSSGSPICVNAAACFRPESGVIVEVTDDFLTIDWIYNPIASSLNYQQKYRRL
jgi:hypothetical protein